MFFFYFQVRLSRDLIRSISKFLESLYHPDLQFIGWDLLSKRMNNLRLEKFSESRIDFEINLNYLHYHFIVNEIS